MVTMPTNYGDAKNFLDDKSMKQVHRDCFVVMGRVTSEVTNEPDIWMRWKGIKIVTFHPDGGMTLRAGINTGGEKGSTTKNRITKCLGDRGQVVQRNFDWFFYGPRVSGGMCKFVDGMTVWMDGGGTIVGFPD